MADASLAEDGYAVTPDVLSAGEVQSLSSALDALAADERDAGTAWFSHRNQRVFNLVRKGPAFLALIDHPVALAIVHRQLGEHALLSSLTANIASPGNTEQPLHADQGYIPLPWVRAEVVNLIWVLDSFTSLNGATRVIPGSHLSHAAPPSDDAPTVPIEAPGGSVVCMDGRLWHGSACNRGLTPRRALFAYYCRPYIRQQENFSRSLESRIRDALNPTQRELLGFDIWLGLGSVDGLPTEWMDGRERIGPV
jgi:ectoine hydroxylase-related dioxygenase (phytanoyl-CoA dioxygenase family)